MESSWGSDSSEVQVDRVGICLRRCSSKSYEGREHQEVSRGEGHQTGCGKQTIGCDGVSQESATE